MRYLQHFTFSVPFVFATTGCSQSLETDDPNSIGDASLAVVVDGHPATANQRRQHHCSCHDPGGCKVNVTLPDGDRTTEAGERIRLVLSLTSRPRGRVTVTAQSSDRTEGIASHAATFQPWRWSEPQTIVVAGRPDRIVDGDRPYQIALAVEAPADCCYDGLTLPQIDLLNEDVDVANVVFSARGSLITTEHGGEAVVDVALSSRPKDGVEVRLNVTDPTEAEVTPTSVRFSAANWNVPKPVTLHGLPDLLADGTVSYELESTVISADPDYANLAPDRLALQNLDGSAFAGIGDLPGGEYQSAAFDVNADGTILVGHSTAAAGREAILWTPAAGLVSLGGTSSAAWGIDSAGEVIAGESVNDESHMVAARWIGGQGPQLLTVGGQLSAFDIPFVAHALGVSGDGHLVVGWVQPYTGLLPFGDTWQVGQDDNPGSLLDGFFTAANQDGSVLVGYRLASKYFVVNCATRNGQCLPYPFAPARCLAPPSCSSKAFDVSLDGTVTVGSAYIEADDEGAAVAWSVDDSGAVSTMTLSSHRQAAALSVSGDGRVIVGYDQYSADASSAAAAARWTDGNSQSIAELLAASGLDMSGWTLTAAHGVSYDGRVIVGEGVNPNGDPEGWIAVIP